MAIRRKLNYSPDPDSQDRRDSETFEKVNARNNYNGMSKQLKRR
jgi:hypothetical protein